MHTKTPSVTIQGNITAKRSQNDVIRSVLLLHIRAKLWCWDGITHHVTWPDTLVTFVANNEQNLRWPAKCLNLNHVDHLLDLLKTKVCIQPLPVNRRELTRVIHQMCAAIPQQYIHRHMLSMSTHYLAVDATPDGCSKYWIEIKYNVIWVCSFCFKGVHVYLLIQVYSREQI